MSFRRTPSLYSKSSSCRWGNRRRAPISPQIILFGDSGESSPQIQHAWRFWRLVSRNISNIKDYSSLDIHLFTSFRLLFSPLLTIISLEDDEYERDPWVDRKGMPCARPFCGLLVAAQTSNRTSVCDHLSVYVPPTLQLSVDFASGGVTRSPTPRRHPGDSDSGFESGLMQSSPWSSAHRLQPQLKLLHCHPVDEQRYTEESGLRQRNSLQPPYRRRPGGALRRCVQGCLFSQDTPGGHELPVSIALGNIPSSAAAGLYTDNLLFNIMAN